MKILLFILFVFHITTHCFSQPKITVLYEGEKRPHPTAIAAIEAQGYTPMISKIAYSLSIQGNSSLFSLDSIMYEQIEDQPFRKYLCWQKIYKNYNTKAFTYQTCQFNGNCFEGKLETIKEVEIIKNEIRQILNFTCFKATFVSHNGTHFEAWYTEEIPYSDGPLLLSSSDNILELPLLPGLILALEEKKTGTHFTATNILVNEDASLEEAACNKVMPISEFRENDYWERLKTNGIKLEVPNIKTNVWYSAVKK